MFPVRSVVPCFVALVSLVNSGELEYPGEKYCPVVNPCHTPLLYNVEYRCGFDEGCSAGYKCCKTDCYIHKVCVVPVDKNGDKIQPPTEGTTDSINNQSSEDDVKEWPASSHHQPTVTSNETNTATELRNVTEVFPTLITLLDNFSLSTLETTVSEHRQVYLHTTDKTAPTVDIRLNDNYTNLDNTSESIVINTSTATTFVSTREEENQDNFITITEKESINVQEANIFSRFSAISFPGPHNFVKLTPAPKWIGIEGSGNDITTDDEDGFIGSGSGSGDDEGSGMIGEDIGVTKYTPNIPEYEIIDTDHHSTTDTTTAIPTSSTEDVEGSGSDTESTSDVLTFTDDEDVFEGSGYRTSSHETAATYPSSDEWNTSHDDFYTTVDGNGINTDSSYYGGSSTSKGGTDFWGSTDIGEDQSSERISTDDDTVQFSDVVSTVQIRQENPTTSHDDVYFPDEFSHDDETSEASFSTSSIDINKSSDPKVPAEGSGDIFNDDDSRDDEDDDDGEITTLPTFDNTKSVNETSNLSFKASSLHSYPVGVNDNVTYEEEDDEEGGDGVDEDIRNNFQGKLIKG